MGFYWSYTLLYTLAARSYVLLNYGIAFNNTMRTQRTSHHTVQQCAVCFQS